MVIILEHREGDRLSDIWSVLSAAERAYIKECSRASTPFAQSRFVKTTLLNTMLFIQERPGLWLLSISLMPCQLPQTLSSQHHTRWEDSSVQVWSCVEKVASFLSIVSLSFASFEWPLLLICIIIGVYSRWCCTWALQISELARCCPKNVLFASFIVLELIVHVLDEQSISYDRSTSGWWRVSRENLDRATDSQNMRPFRRRCFYGVMAKLILSFSYSSCFFYFISYFLSLCLLTPSIYITDVFLPSLTPHFFILIFPPLSSFTP